MGLDGIMIRWVMNIRYLICSAFLATYTYTCPNHPLTHSCSSPTHSRTQKLALAAWQRLWFWFIRKIRSRFYRQSSPIPRGIIIVVIIVMFRYVQPKQHPRHLLRSLLQR